MASSSGIKAGSAFVELALKDGIDKGLQIAQAKLKAFGATISSIGTKLAAIGGIGFAPLMAAAKSASSMGGEMLKASQRTGVSVENLSALAAAAGGDVEGLAGSINKMQRSLVELATGSSSAGEAFGMLGLKLSDMESLSPDQQFKTIADAISKLPDPALRTAEAMAIFGRSGAEMLPLLMKGRSGIEAAERMFKKFGATMTTEDALGSKKLGTQLGILGQVVRMTWEKIGSALAPVAAQAVESFTGVVAPVLNWISANRELFVSIFKVSAALTGAGAGLVLLGKGVTVFATIATTGLSLVGTVAAAVLSPMGLLAATAAGIGAYLLTSTATGAAALTALGNKFDEVRGTALEAWGAIMTAMGNGDLAAAANVAFSALDVAWLKTTQGMSGGWATFVAGMSTAAVSEWANFKKGCETIFHWMQVALIEVGDVLRGTWGEISKELKLLWIDIARYAQIAWTWVSATAHGENASNAIQAINDAADAAKKETVGKAGANAVNRSSNKSEMMDSEDRRYAKAMAEIEGNRSAMQGGIDTVQAEKLKAAEENAKKAIADYKRALKDVQAEKLGEDRGPAGEAGAAVETPRRKALSALSQVSLGLSDAKIQVGGSFNTAAAGLLGYGGNMSDKLLKKQDELKEWLKKIAENTADGGAKYA